MSEETGSEGVSPLQKRFEVPPAVTITLGKYKSGAEYLKALADAGVAVSSRVRDTMLSREFVCSQQEHQAEIVLAAGFQLGFPKAMDFPTLGEIEESALKMGFKLSPAEVAAALPLSGINLSKSGAHSDLYVLSEPLVHGSIPYAFIFKLGQHGGMNLEVENAMESHLFQSGSPEARRWHTYKRFVLVKPAK